MNLGAMYCADYYYINHFRKKVCFHYKFNKRVKTKVTNFLRKNHEESKIIKFLDQLDLILIKESKSRNYLHYSIVEKNESEENK